MSHLPYPPLLDELGLESALRWYTEGFSERSKIKVELQLASDLVRLSTELETAIFRIMQECLMSIHRHSGSKTATIQIFKVGFQISVVVNSEGRLKHSLQLLVSEANIQLGELPDFCLRSDELSLSFNKWRMALVGNFQSEISLTNHLASTRSNGNSDIWTVSLGPRTQ